MRTKLFSFFPSMLALCLLFGAVNVYAGPPTGPAAMQVMGGSVVSNGAKLMVLENKVRELTALRHVDKKRNASKIARLEREIEKAKGENCIGSPNYNLCVQYQHEITVKAMNNQQEILTGCADGPPEFQEGGRLVNGERKCREKAGLIPSEAVQNGCFDITTVYGPGGSTYFKMVANGTCGGGQPRKTPSSSVTQSALNGWSPWERFGVAAASCAAGGLGGAALGYKIGDHADPDTDLFKGGKLVGVDHGSGDLGKWIGAAAGCVVGGATALVVTDDD